MPPELNLDRRRATQAVIDDAGLEELLAIFAVIDDETRAIVLATLGQRVTARERDIAINTLRQTLASHNDELNNWIVGAMSLAYIRGANQMLDDINELGIRPTRRGVFTGKLTIELIRGGGDFQRHRDSINAFVSDTHSEIAKGLTGIVDTSRRQFNDALKRQISGAIDRGNITGSDIRTIANEVRDTIGRQGYSSLIYRNGANWTIPNYSKMIARTNTMKAYTEATINRAIEYGVDLVQVSSHPHDPDICSQYDGRIYSLSGTSDKYPLLPAKTPFHPNCKHSLTPRPYAEVA